MFALVKKKRIKLNDKKNVFIVQTRQQNIG